MSLVYDDWSESLANFSIGAIKFAIEKAKAMKHPPNQGEFKELCKEYIPSSPVLQLRRKFTPEELETNRKRLADIAEGLGMKMKADRA